MYLEDLPSCTDDSPLSLSSSQDDSIPKALTTLNLSKFYSLYSVTQRILSFRDKPPLPQLIDPDHCDSDSSYLLEIIHSPRDLDEIYRLSDNHKSCNSRIDV